MVTHGYSKTPTYKSWASMKQRCLNKNDPYYKYYGGAGIRIYNKWFDFSNFLEDMGTRPDGMTLDRIDSNDDYVPSNCRWADLSTQQINKPIRDNNKSGYLGVHKHSKSGKWRATIRFQNSGVITIGEFDDIEEAAYIRDQFAMQIHGDIAVTNFDY